MDPPAALPSRTRLLPSRGPLSSSEKTRPPLPATVSLRSSYHLHRPSPPPLLTGSDRHRHHRAIAIAAKTNKTSGKKVHECSGRKRREASARGGEKRNGMKNARDSESSFRWSYWRTKVNLQLGREGWKFTARVSTWTVVVWMIVSRGTGRDGKIPPKIE